MKRTLLLLTVGASLAGLSSCTHQAAYGPNTTRDAATGAVIGGLAGGIIGNQSNHAGEGILLGAALGGLSGAAIGNQKDQAQGYAPHYPRQHENYRRSHY